MSEEEFRRAGRSLITFEKIIGAYSLFFMPAQKRSLEDSSSTHKIKKPKTTRQPENAQPAPVASSLTADEVDFPRGGGTSFTPLEVKAIRAEAMNEANEELFNVRETRIYFKFYSVFSRALLKNIKKSV